MQNGLNQQINIGGSTATWDARGNLTAEPQSAKTYGYSSENLLISASGSVTLGYDPGMRLYQVAGAATTRFAYDGVNAIADYDGSNALQHRYVFAPGIDQPIVQYDASGNRAFLGTDERGSIVSLTDSSGTLIGLNRYDEYGKPQSTNLGRFQYTGQMWLSEIGAYYYKARVYLPHLGIFAQTDPIGSGGGISLYAYVGNNPINLTDPLGTDPFTGSRIGGSEESPYPGGCSGESCPLQSDAPTRKSGATPFFKSDPGIAACAAGNANACLGLPSSTNDAPGYGNDPLKFAPLNSAEQRQFYQLVSTPEFISRATDAYLWTMLSGDEHAFVIWLSASGSFTLGPIWAGFPKTMGPQYTLYVQYEVGQAWGDYHVHPGDWYASSGPSWGDRGFDTQFHLIGIIGSKWGLISSWGH